MKKLLLAAAVLVIAMAACNEKQSKDLISLLMGNAHRRTAGKNAGYQTGRGRGCIFH